MAKRNTRDKQKRRFESMDGNLETTQGYLLDFANIYMQDHPDLATQAFLICEGIEEIRKACEVLKEQF